MSDICYSGHIGGERLFYFRQANPDGTLIEMVVWKIPPDKARRHGFKYRLHYGTRIGRCIVRYDNETNKGDHRHIGKKEESYVFMSLKNCWLISSKTYTA